MSLLFCVQPNDVGCDYNKCNRKGEKIVFVSREWIQGLHIEPQVNTSDDVRRQGYVPHS